MRGWSVDYTPAAHLSPPVEWDPLRRLRASCICRPQFITPYWPRTKGACGRKPFIRKSCGHSIRAITYVSPIPTKPNRISIPFLQISEAIRRYGVSDSATSLFVVEIGALPSHHDKIKAIVNGTISPFSRLSEVTDWATIKKVYCTRPSRPFFLPLEQYHKLNGELAIQHIRHAATAHAVIDEIVISTVAMKSVSQ